MTKLEKLEEAIGADRFDGRIKAIKEAFKEYKESLGKPSLWQRIKEWFKSISKRTKTYRRKGGEIL